MTKNQFLFLLVIIICAVIVANISASIYVISMLFTEMSFALIVVGIGYLVGKSVLNLQLLYLFILSPTTKSVFPMNEVKSYASFSQYAAVIAAVVSAYGVLLGDFIYAVIAYNEDGTPYTGEYVYLEIFLVPFEFLLMPITTITFLFAVFTSYFDFANDFMYSFLSLFFLGFAMYLGYVSARGFNSEA